ncbi:UDP-N-acetylglucosamine 2-epimerase [Comamonas sp.]|uniref:UDP-N-acetylglucosamine 2-epimerase n=1 Tax=Comamonas sp. TaxID=34028 RepID=UPI00258AA1E9|nr:UDP-N-acetylglucosamine 2-epimerase [Comamonas sp.]
MSDSSIGRSLLFVTGTRADYGKLKPLALAAQEAGFLISFFITGMHMMKRYGETRHEVRRFGKAEFFEFVNQREGDSLDFILSKTILGFSDFVHEHRPDLVVIHGDRVEALATSIVCALRYIRSAHIEGGEISGSIDESIRHCNTKLCVNHFVSNDQAKNRVLALGESPERVFNIGSPELDTHARPSGVTIDKVKKRYGISFSEYGVVIFHPITSEQNSGLQAKLLFEALDACGKCFVVIAPNNDPGTESVLEVLKVLPVERFLIIPSMRGNYFSELMKNAQMIIGNSSTGVREAPFLGLPSLNIGTRQNGRSKSSSIKNVQAKDSDEIKNFIKVSWGKRVEKSTDFGFGEAASEFVNIISKECYWETSLQKQFFHA